MTSQECLGGKIDQIWSGLISINRKNQKPKETKKKQTKKKQCFPAWSEHAQIQVVPKPLFYFCLFCFVWGGWVINHSKFYFPQKRLMYGQQKANMVLDFFRSCNVFWEQLPFARPQQDTTSLSAFLIEKACAWTTHIRSQII